MNLKILLCVLLSMITLCSYSQDCVDISLDGQPSSTLPTCASPEGSIRVNALNRYNNPLEYALKLGAQVIYPYQDEGVFIDLGVGTYEILIRDKTKRGCYVSIGYTLRGEKTVRIQNIETTKTSCFSDQGTGTITVNATDATNIEYSLDGNNWQSENVFTNKTAGNYTVYVRAASITDPNVKCIVSRRTSVTSGYIEYTGTYAHIICENKLGLIRISATGRGAIEYKLEGTQNTNWQSSGEFLNLEQGQYTVLMRDTGDDNCEKRSRVYNIIPKLPFRYVKVDADCNQSNGNIIINPVYSGIYEFSLGGTVWQDSNEFSNLSSGNYRFYVRSKSDSDCVSSKVISVDEIPDITLTLDTKTDTECNKSDGSIQVSSTSNNVEFTLLQNNSVITTNTSGFFDNLPSGSYSVETPSAQCENKISVTINENNDITVQTPEPGTTTCNASTANINFDATSNVGSQLEYSIDGGATFQASSTFNSLARGEYNYVIRSLNTECTQEGSFDILENTDLLILEHHPQKPAFSCDTGAFRLKARGAVLYRYTTEDGSASDEITLADVGLNDGAEYTFQGLAPNIYNFFARDVNGCEIAFERVDLSSPFTIDDITPIPTTCSSNNGKISITATGVNLKFKVSADDDSYESDWQEGVANGDGSFTSLFENLLLGTYSIFVKEDVETISNIDCQLARSNITIKNVGEVGFENIDISHTSCARDNGRVVLRINSQGGNYDYAVLPKGTEPQESDYTAFRTFDNLEPGTYTAFMRDSGIVQGEQYQCLGKEDFIINQSSIPTFELEAPPLVCGQGPIDIQIVNVQGGTGTIKFSLNETEDYQDVRSFTVSEPGLYKITAKDESIPDCKLPISQEVELKCEALFPDVFVPNKNGKNEILRILYEDDNFLPLEILEFSVFNRKGNLVHQASNFFSDEVSGWWNGEGYQTGYYTILCKYKIGDTTQTYTGTVYLLR